MQRSVIALSTLALLAACCSVSCADSSSTQPPKATSSSSAPQSPAPTPPAHVGDKLDLAPIGGAESAVTLVGVINPATVTEGAADTTKTYVATKLTITNTGTTTIVGDANNNVAVIGSDGQTYTADFTSATGCGNFTYGQFLVAPDESVTGCVVFALPAGVTPAKVKYMPSSGISDDVGVWLTS